MKVLSLLTALFITNCGQLQDINDVIIMMVDVTPKYKGVEPELEKYYEEFSAIHNIDISKISATFNDLDMGILGVCRKYKDGTRAIEIDLHSWIDADDNSRESTMFHELGHCALELGHNWDKIEKDGVIIPESIMFPYDFSSDVYEEYRDYYMERLKMESGRL